jgi:hypothetical protein
MLPDRALAHTKPPPSAPTTMHQSIINNLTVLFLTAAYAVTIGTVWLWCRPW